ncbi:MAG: ABC transporter substrate-binding protein [Chitinivibrionia bacterium]|nr:ABC transporter substrate-binding protein [Chitinivibrionia bacterium]
MVSPKLTMRRKLNGIVHSRWFLGWAITAAVAVLLGGISYVLVPPPPGTLVLSTGIDGGAYAAFAEKYRRILARENVKVRLLASSGSVENYRRLRDSKARVDAGFVQDGTGSSSEARNLISLGAICYSPLWVFYRSSKILDDLSELKGKRIAIGAPGSGVREISKGLLGASGTDRPPTQLLDLQGSAANKALLEGKVDAVMIVGTEDNSLVRELLYEPSVKLINFRQAEAYARLFPKLSHVILPRGILDLSGKKPAEDVHLLAATMPPWRPTGVPAG